MPRASKKIINKELDEELNQSFSFLISSLRDKKEINDFFRDFLTKEEKKMLPKRLMLHLMLFNDIPDSKINSHLGMSYETIRIHRNSWDSFEPNYKMIIEMISKRKNTKELLKKFGQKLEKVDAFLSAKSNMKARSKVFSND
ncbi:MAG: Trp family transcriptional regulator [Patescibacteria group bacterium]